MMTALLSYGLVGLMTGLLAGRIFRRPDCGTMGDTAFAVLGAILAGVMVHFLLRPYESGESSGIYYIRQVGPEASILPAMLGAIVFIRFWRAWTRRTKRKFQHTQS